MEFTGHGSGYVKKCVRDACIEYLCAFGQTVEFRFPGLAEESLSEFRVTVSEVEDTLVAALSTVVANYELDRAEIDAEVLKRRRESVVQWMAKGAAAAVARSRRAPISNR